VPVSLLPPRYAAELERPRHAPPLVGSERVQRLWREVAERHELAFDGRAMRGERRGVTVAVEREHRGRGGVHLVGQLAYPSLDLDLNIEPAKRWRSGRRGVQIGADAWDRAHRVTCRDDSQIHAVLPALRPALLPLSALHLDDTGARAERRDAGTSKQRLWDFANKMVVLANAVAAARERVPPPTSMRDHADAWRELAATLDGALSVARMQIAGTAGGMPAFVRTEWSADGEPLRTVLGVRTPHIIDQRHRGVWSADSDGERDDEAERSDGEPASPTRARALSAATAWEIAADSIAITREAPIADPRPLAAQLRAIAAWSRELSSVGVYR
jgi:hypothetical protein